MSSRESVIRVGVNAAAPHGHARGVLIDGKSYFDRLEDVLHGRRGRSGSSAGISTRRFGFSRFAADGGRAAAPMRGGHSRSPCAHPRLGHGADLFRQDLPLLLEDAVERPSRISLKFDLRHPIRACHHQKMGDRRRHRLSRRHGSDRQALGRPVPRPRQRRADLPRTEKSTDRCTISRRWCRARRHRWWPTSPGGAGSAQPANPRTDPRDDLAWPADLQPALSGCRTAVALTEPWTWRRKGRARRSGSPMTH